jgi:hypothetical protein
MMSAGAMLAVGSARGDIPPGRDAVKQTFSTPENAQSPVTRRRERVHSGAHGEPASSRVPCRGRRPWRHDALANPPANSRLAQLRRFHFDADGSANPVTMMGLRTLVGSSHVYGTDYSFGGANGPADIVRNLQRCGFTAAESGGVDRENAPRILSGKYAL